MCIPKGQRPKKNKITEETKMTELEMYYERYEKITKKYDKA